MTTTHHHTAIQTEYGGVVFRSKSEAITARAFDLQGRLWEYEPKGFYPDSQWTPDFLLSWKSKNLGIVSVILEFKPAPPTNTYKEALGGRFSQIKLQGSDRWGLLLLVCDPFNPTNPSTISEWIDGAWAEWDSPRGLISKIDMARGYRFDLKNGGAA